MLTVYGLSSQLWSHVFVLCKVTDIRSTYVFRFKKSERERQSPRLRCRVLDLPVGRRELAHLVIYIYFHTEFCFLAYVAAVTLGLSPWVASPVVQLGGRPQQGQCCWSGIVSSLGCVGGAFPRCAPGKGQRGRRAGLPMKATEG
jgi:hypothetical protein